MIAVSAQIVYSEINALDPGQVEKFVALDLRASPSSCTLSEFDRRRASAMPEPVWPACGPRPQISLNVRSPDRQAADRRRRRDQSESRHSSAIAGKNQR